MNAAKDHTIKDSIKDGWVERMPIGARPYLRLSRLDRPVGFWLLTLPGWIGLAFATLSTGFAWADLKWAALILIGAIAMRGAGCTYNDIVDRDLDAKVDRTALRPIPSGTVSLKQAWLWLGFQCLIGLIVLLFFPRIAQITAISSLALVAGYPYMKRITFWPQAWLGLTFNWAVLVAYVTKTGTFTPGIGILYLGLVFWTIGYDTIYACQDAEDDAMIGVKSTARLFGEKVRTGVSICYAICFSLVLTSVVIFQTPLSIQALLPTTIVCLSPFALHLIYQASKIDHQNSKRCLQLFKSNQYAGLILTACVCLLSVYLRR